MSSCKVVAVAFASYSRIFSSGSWERVKVTIPHMGMASLEWSGRRVPTTFSAMEVIPLLLLTLEAWSFMRSGERSVAGGQHLHRWAIWFLVAVGVWNFLGAGVFGFLINLNAGLTWMAFCNLFPVGVVQLHDALE